MGNKKVHYVELKDLLKGTKESEESKLKRVVRKKKLILKIKKLNKKIREVGN